MSRPAWSPGFSPDAKVSEHDRQPLLALRGDGTGVLFIARRYEGRGLEWRVITRCDTRRPWLTTRHITFLNGQIGAYLPDSRGEGPDILSAPGWRPPDWSWVTRILPILAVFGFFTAVAGLDVAFGFALFLIPLMYPFLPSFGTVEVDSLAQLPLDATNVVEYAEKRASGIHPETLEEMPHRERIRERIATIRERYGALKLDIVYRIEHPALFDPQAEHTARFQSALVRAEDLDDSAPVQALEKIASELEILFSVAKRHAEAVGIAHLPPQKREDGRRAAKVARLSKDAGSEGERAAALVQLNRVLASLSLHYLPAVKDVRAIEE